VYVIACDLEKSFTFDTRSSAITEGPRDALCYSKFVLCFTRYGS